MQTRPLFLLRDYTLRLAFSRYLLPHTLDPRSGQLSPAYAVGLARLVCMLVGVAISLAAQLTLMSDLEQTRKTPFLRMNVPGFLVTTPLYVNLGMMTRAGLLASCAGWFGLNGVTYMSLIRRYVQH